MTDLEHEPIALGEPPVIARAKVLTTGNGVHHLVYRGSREIVRYFLHVPGAQVHDGGRTLTMPLTRENVMALEILGQLEEADPSYVAAVQKVLQPSAEALELYPTPAPDAPPPRAHQLAAFGWALDAFIGGKTGFINTAVLGAGKTRMAIDLMRKFAATGRSVVIGQKTTLEQWVEQLQIAWPDADAYVLHEREAMEKRRLWLEELRWREVPPYQILLVNWESIAKLEKDLKKFPKFDLIVADEASRLLGRTTDMARAAKALAWKHAWYAHPMTGTPIRKSVEDLFALGQFADSRTFGSRIADFRTYYCDTEGFGSGAQSVPKPERVLELVTRFYSFGYRISRAAVDMPEPVRRVVTLAPSKEQREELDRIKSDPTTSSGNALTRILRRRQITAGYVMRPHDLPAASWDGEHEEALRPALLDDPKLDWIERYLAENWEAEDGKFMVWTAFIPEIETVYQRLVDRFGSDAVARLDGSVPDSRRQVIRRAVNDRSSALRVLVCNLQTGAMGLDLPGIDVMMYHSSTYNYVDRKQSEGRGTRLGKTRACQIIDLVLRGTIDEEIADVIAQKQSLNDLLVGQGFVRQFGSEHGKHGSRTV